MPVTEATATVCGTPWALRGGLFAFDSISKFRSPLLIFSDSAERTTYEQKSRQTVHLSEFSQESQPHAQHADAPLVPLPSRLLKAQDLGSPPSEPDCAIGAKTAAHN